MEFDDAPQRRYREGSGEHAIERWVFEITSGVDVNDDGAILFGHPNRDARHEDGSVHRVEDDVMKNLQHRRRLDEQWLEGRRREADVDALNASARLKRGDDAFENGRDIDPLARAGWWLDEIDTASGALDELAETLSRFEQMSDKLTLLFVQLTGDPLVEQFGETNDRVDVGPELL